MAPKIEILFKVIRWRKEGATGLMSEDTKFFLNNNDRFLGHRPSLQLNKYMYACNRSLFLYLFIYTFIYLMIIFHYFHNEEQ